MSATISERAAAKGPRPHRVACPSCEVTFDLNKIGKPRSPQQHARFFAIVRAAFFHWPEKHLEQFSTQEAFRGWLIMKAGPAWRDEVARVHLSGMRVEHAKMLATQIITCLDEKATSRVHNGVMVVFRPKSIRFDKLSHLGFCALNDAVAEVIAAEMHVTVDELLNQHEGAA